MKRINVRRIKAKHSYHIEVLAELLSVHSNTIHSWIKEGLPRIDNAYPYTLYGEEIIAFLKERQKKNKVKLGMDEFYCCKCQAARTAWQGLADLQIRTSKTAILKAVCNECNAGLNKLISLRIRDEIAELLTVHTIQGRALAQPANANVNCETKGVTDDA